MVWLVMGFCCVGGGFIVLGVFGYFFLCLFYLGIVVFVFGVLG